ncbi:MAG: DUF547 domain-containing protein [Caulobacterales bacterium]
MIRRRDLFWGVFLLPMTPFEAEAAEDAFNELIGRYVIFGADGVARVDYRGWKDTAADRAALAGAISAFARTPFAELGRAAQFAAWANLYNALTVAVVLDHYPIASIRDVKSRVAGIDLKALIGPWREKRIEVAGRKLSLDDIENAIMRPTFKDPRVHYALNCASVGCPDLRVWRAATLEVDLDAAARAYVNHPRGVALTARGIRLSSIFDWYADDFGGRDQGVRTHLASYARPAIAEALRSRPIDGYDYDWSLNDAADPKGRP